ncbi:hypothetical protein OS493_003903, partial [Desmophyllum pertusum]
SVKKVLKVPRYYLRNRSKPYVIVKASTPKVDSSLQCDLSEEENRELSKELPFVLSNGDLSRPTNEGHPSGLQSGNFPRSSTAYSTPDQANITDRDARDISIDQSREPSIVQPNSSVQRLSDGSREDSDDSFLADFQPIHSSHLQGDPRIALEVEDISGSEIGEPSHTVKSSAAQFPVINSPADLYTLVRNSPRRINYQKSKPNKREALINLSSSDESEESSDEDETGSEGNDTSASTEEEIRDEKETSTKSSSMTEENPAEMDKELIDTLSKIAQRLGTKDINIAKFYGYDREDIDQWLEEFDYHLEARYISPRSKTALTQLTIHIAGPAQEYIRALPADQRATLDTVKEALKRCYSRRNREWVQRQKISQRRQKSGEPLGDYVSDMVTKLNKLDMQENSRVYHFIEGLKPELQMEVLKAKPQTLSEAIETAKEFDALLVRATKSTASEYTSERP